MPLYSPKELARLYNGVKIKCNPTAYSFRDRLIEDSKTRSMADKRISRIGFNAEETLLANILNFWEVSDDPKNYGVYGYCDPNYQKVWRDLCSQGFLLTVYTDHSIIFVEDDNLNFNPTAIATNLGMGSTEFKKAKLLESFVTACYLLKSAGCIAADLKYVTTNMVDNGFSYESLHSLQHLKDALEARNVSEMYVQWFDSPMQAINCPVPVSECSANPASTFADSRGYCESQTTTMPHAIGYTNFLKHMYYETIAFGTELVYQIYTKLESSENRKLYELLVGRMVGKDNEITKLMYVEGKDSFIPVEGWSEDPATRFKEIAEYIRRPEVRDIVEKVCARFMAYAGYVPIPSMFGAVLSYAKNYSARVFRIKQCAILYNYCKANKLIEDRDPVMDAVHSDDSGDSSLFREALEEAFGEGGTEDPLSLIDLEPHSPSSEKPTGESRGHSASSMSQALDGLIDNFRDGKYGFTVKDVYSEDPSLKERYEDIASKIKLVNSQLIKQIRDIKTYNMGGKYAGLSTGKLDRKNIHKYKTDKNIFYQNTYKQKECDLAFGIVLDASGSMSGRGIIDGRTTMIVLHETLKALGINHSIIDHTCYGAGYTSDLRRYQCFREDKGYRVRKNYALAGITAESGNCDSGALWFMEKALMRTRNKDKICLIFSDGAPTECSGSDLIEQVKHMERQGIKVIGIGIGFPNISRYYSEYANGNNLKQMLDIVAGILKEYVLAKKE